MDELVAYRLEESVAVITLDDGKVNALSPRMLAAIGVALDRAAADDAIVLLTGRPGVFSAGFDLGVLRAGGEPSVAMVRAGFELAVRLLSFPRPVVVSCTGHAIAMGAFLVLSGDYRIGATGLYKITANEVAIGITMPRAAIEICRQRLVTSHLTRATLLADVYLPAEAVTAGFLDRTVDGAELADVALRMAQQLVSLDSDSHRATKQRLREPVLTAVRQAIAMDSAAAMSLVS
jgi:enoyl-CoA hydratase